MSEQESPAGFGLVEVIIAMLLLGLIAVSLIPLLWQGISNSVEQADVATATRHVNALIEQARANPSCAGEDSAGAPAFPNPSALPHSYTDPRGGTVTVHATSGQPDPSNPALPAYVCSPGVAVTVVLTARDAGSEVLAVASAKILMNP